jgi:hypothetical protein
VQEAQWPGHDRREEQALHRARLQVPTELRDQATRGDKQGDNDDRLTFQTFSVRSENESGALNCSQAHASLGAPVDEPDVRENYTMPPDYFTNLPKDLLIRILEQSRWTASSVQHNMNLEYVCKEFAGLGRMGESLKLNLRLPPRFHQKFLEYLDTWIPVTEGRGVGLGRRPC